jgi:hypothetical protein
VTSPKHPIAIVSSLDCLSWPIAARVDQHPCQIEQRTVRPTTRKPIAVGTAIRPRDEKAEPGGSILAAWNRTSVFGEQCSGHGEPMSRRTITYQRELDLDSIIKQGDQPCDHR